MTSFNSSVAEQPSNNIYRAFWRWHFYAGLLVMPVLMLMALTGGIYLFKDDIENALNRQLVEVAPLTSSTSPQAWSDAAVAAVPGRVVQVTPPADTTRSARLVVEQAGGVRTAVFVDPSDARVLGSTPEAGAMDLMKRLHSLDIAGPVFNLMVEVVAGWSIVMVATGIVLWWPRGNGGGVVTIRSRPSKRVFWRDFHAVTGLFTGAVIVFLAVTGMPWSAVWGKEVRKFTTEAGWGRPAMPTAVAASGHDPAHADHQPDASAVPWTLQETDVHSAHAANGPGLDLNAAIAHAEGMKLAKPYTVAIPATPDKAWSASTQPEQVEQMRTIYLDSGNGQMIADLSYAQFGPAAKAIEWGISVHQGKEFGLGNKLLMLAGCVAIWLLGISAIVMWWKRRPKGQLSAPPRPIDRKAYIALAAVVVPLGIIYPLVGVSLIVVLGGDILVRRVAAAIRPSSSARP
ncbi:MAG: PepSY domain-containing protein [Burkholderiales bacterium]|nr:MAG: PepSY domain-containing protein [Burkholderiales bacterium]